MPEQCGTEWMDQLPEGVTYPPQGWDTGISFPVMEDEVRGSPLETCTPIAYPCEFPFELCSNNHQYNLPRRELGHNYR